MQVVYVWHMVYQHYCATFKPFKSGQFPRCGKTLRCVCTAEFNQSRREGGGAHSSQMADLLESRKQQYHQGRIQGKGKSGIESEGVREATNGVKGNSARITTDFEKAVFPTRRQREREREKVTLATAQITVFRGKKELNSTLCFNSHVRLPKHSWKWLCHMRRFNKQSDIDLRRCFVEERGVSVKQKRKAEETVVGM